MPTWSSRGLRGSALEDLINETNAYYSEHELALVQKIPTPITPIQMNQSKNQITLAYFDKKSTVDYIGVVQGVPVCFDAKECKESTFPLHNMHEHQVEFMKRFEKQEGVSFFLLYFTDIDEFYYLRFSEFLTFYDRMEQGGRKSFRRDELSDEYFFKTKAPVLCPYLPLLQKDLLER